MFNLDLLAVSLTKHGAHKIAKLLDEYTAEEAILHVDENEFDIHIDQAQVRNNLGYREKIGFPAIWNRIRESGVVVLNPCVLLSIIFSHRDLIRCMQKSENRFGQGIVLRDEIIGGKSFTNIANDFEELGFISEHTDRFFSYNISSIINNPIMGSLVKEIIYNKMLYAGMEASEDFFSLCKAYKLNGVFGLTFLEFSTWISNGIISVVETNDETWGNQVDDRPIKEYSFRSGHANRDTEQIFVKTSQGVYKKDQLHSEIQNHLFVYLSSMYGEKNVGSENRCREYTRIDMVAEQNGETTFYEIKTSPSLKSCIREALSQLMEYAYWPNNKRCEKMYIVSQNELDKNGTDYLMLLKAKFGLPVGYIQYIARNNSFLIKDI